ncbi:MAG: prepilin-type N-terminal cleavage/methylation domain-containing protein [Gammaproteobacteria bacterium]|nr:prepilin-type N-terminal cleavage/methylation domain-containing protein [Gammaproteobacteria bacterium]MDH5799968.1 prepilin-type N-terminal cleavage/methylation domain-containing protein [Gammaproteobacteria bacterium]
MKSVTQLRLPKRLVSNSGFTLVEVMLSISLLATLLVLVFAGMRFVTTAWDKGVRKYNGHNEVYMAQNWLRRTFAAVPALLLDAGGSPVDSREVPQYVAFEGSAQKMRFVATLPHHYGGGGLHVLELDGQGGVDKAQLLLSTRLLPLGSKGLFQSVSTPATESEVLLTDIVEARFSYLGEDVTGQWRWQETWSGRDILPYQVRIDLQLKSGVSWPGFVATLHSDGKRGPARVPGLSLGCSGTISAGWYG